jgi:hypothetical protein
MLRLLVAVVCLGLVGACSEKKEEPKPVGGPVALTTTPAKTPAKTPAPAVERKPGQIPFDYPAVATTAKAGDYVIAPSKNWIDEAFVKGGTKQTFIYYGSWMVTPGPLESKIKTLPGKEVTIPNGMIVPIRSGETAKPGDIILTTWQSGSGMQRAIVVPGGTPATPKVMYLDLDYDNPAGVGKKVDQLKPNTFQKQKDGLEVGNVVAVKVGHRLNRAIVVGVAGDKVLVIGFAGRMSVQPKANVVPVPIKPAVKAGEEVWVPQIGSFGKAKVDKVDAAIGRVWVTYTWGGKEKKAAIAFGDVAKGLQ